MQGRHSCKHITSPKNFFTWPK